MHHADASPLTTRRALNRALLLHVLVLGLIAGLPYLHKPAKVDEPKAIQAVLVERMAVHRPEPVTPAPVEPVQPPPPPPVPEKIEVPEPVKPVVREEPRIVLPKPKLEPKPIEKPVEKPLEKPVAKKPEPVKPLPKKSLLTAAALKTSVDEAEMNAMRNDIQQAEFKRELDRTMAQAQAGNDEKELARYSRLIKDKVSRFAQFPPGSEGKSVHVRISILPGGEVTNAIVVKSSGDPNIDAIVRAAALKATPLPVPEDPRLFNNFRSGVFAFTVE